MIAYVVESQPFPQREPELMAELLQMFSDGQRLLAWKRILDSSSIISNAISLGAKILHELNMSICAMKFIGTQQTLTLRKT